MNESPLTQIWASGGGVQSAAIAAMIVQGKLRPDVAVIADTGREQSTTWSYMDEIITPALATVGVVLQRVASREFSTVDLYGGKDGESLLIPVFTVERCSLQPLRQRHVFCLDSRIFPNQQGELRVMKQELTPTAGSPDLLAFWWTCIEAGYEIEHNDQPMPDDTLILHYCANGTTCMVFARDIRAAVALINESGRSR